MKEPTVHDALEFLAQCAQDYVSQLPPAARSATTGAVNQALSHVRSVINAPQVPPGLAAALVETNPTTEGQPR